jgi:hypothetical protein
VALDSEIRPLKLPGQALFGRRWLLTGGRSPQHDPSMRTYAATSPCALPSQSSLQERTAFLFHLRLKHSKQAAAICSHAPSRLGSLAPSPLGAWPRLANCCQALCSRITLNGATQPKPNLWSLTLTSLLWLGRPTSTPVLTPSKPLRESVTPSCGLGYRSRVDQPRWLLETICPALGPRRLRATSCCASRRPGRTKTPAKLWAVGSAELSAADTGGSPQQRRRRSHSAQEADESLRLRARRLPLRCPKFSAQVDSKPRDCVRLLSTWKILCLSVPPTEHIAPPLLGQSAQLHCNVMDHLLFLSISLRGSARA